MLKDKELTTRVITAAVYVAIMIAFILPGLWVPFIPILLFAVVAFVMAYEKSLGLNRRMPGIRALPVAIATVLLGALSFLGVLSGTFLRGIPKEATQSLGAAINNVIAPRIIGYFALFTLFLLSIYVLYRVWRQGPEMLPHAIAESSIVLTSSFPLVSVVALLYGCGSGWHWLVLAVLTSWVSDACAWFAGRRFGRRPLSSSLSPRKTIEGFVGGMLGTVLLYLIYVPLVIGKRVGFPIGASFAFAILAALLMSAFGAMGDLRLSAVKRWCGIKDFGAMLPGHGGVTDRFDSMTMTLPAMLLLAILAQTIA